MGRFMPVESKDSDLSNPRNLGELQVRCGWVRRKKDPEETSGPLFLRAGAWYWRLPNKDQQAGGHFYRINSMLIVRTIATTVQYTKKAP